MESIYPELALCGRKMSVLGLILSFSPYLRSAVSLALLELCSWCGQRVVNWPMNILRVWRIETISSLERRKASWRFAFWLQWLPMYYQSTKPWWGQQLEMYSRVSKFHRHTVMQRRKVKRSLIKILFLLVKQIPYILMYFWCIVGAILCSFFREIFK